VGCFILIVQDVENELRVAMEEKSRISMELASVQHDLAETRIVIDSTACFVFLITKSLTLSSVI
jgi:hypothetical protein